MKKLRLCVAAVLVPPWFVATIGFGWFLFSIRWPIGVCTLGALSPWDSLMYWAKSGCVEPIGEVLSNAAWRRLAWSGGTSVVLFGLMAWSLRGSVVWRPSLRLRTLMILIAVSAFAYVGGRETWDAWSRWNHCAQMVAHFESEEEIYHRVLAEDLSDEERPLYIEYRRVDREQSRRRKEAYERAMWRPWVDPPAPAEVDD